MMLATQTYTAASMETGTFWLPRRGNYSAQTKPMGVLVWIWHKLILFRLWVELTWTSSLVEWMEYSATSAHHDIFRSSKSDPKDFHSIILVNWTWYGGLFKLIWGLASQADLYKVPP